MTERDELDTQPFELSPMSLRKRTSQALGDSQLRKNLRGTLGAVAYLRQLAISEVDNWEELRRHAHQVKTHTLARLAHYLVQLEERVVEQGGRVVWTGSAREASQFIVDLAHRKEIRSVVKSKTMTGEEIHLNQALERARVKPVETDLGEYIVQLAGQTPSHIIAPALHLSKQQVSGLFTEKLGMEPTEDVEEITRTARKVLRRQFLRARMGVTGVNFAVAETGTIVVVENEGNARLCVSVPRIHVAVMGIEKVVPRLADLPVFLKLLIRSATGQKISSYVNFVNGVRREGEMDGPSEFYLVLVDNGRSQTLQDEVLRETLACIRCGACLNFCPVYQNVGGHAYGSTYQGPIGAILTPQLASEGDSSEHPFASSLCGACQEVCPVKIEIPRMLLALRERTQQRKNARASHIPVEKTAMQLWAWAMQSEQNYRRASRWSRRLHSLASAWGVLRFFLPPLRRWSEQREWPEVPPKTFREAFEEEEKP